MAILAIAITVFIFFSASKKTSDSEMTEKLKLNIVSVTGMVDDSLKAQSVRTLVGATEIVDDDSFTVDGLDGGRHLAFVTDTNDAVVAFGFVTSGHASKLGSESSAVVLLFMASGALFLPYEAWPSVIDEMEKFVAHDSIANTLTTIQKEDPHYLFDENEKMRSSIEAAVVRLKSQPIARSFFEIPVAHAKEFRVDSNPKSGIRVDRGAYPNEIYITNEYRRILRSLIYEIGYRKNGEDTIYQIKDIQLEATVDTPTIGKLTDVSATLIDYFALGKTHYGEVRSDSVYLEPDHPEADATYYRVMALGWGLRWPSPGDLTLEALTEQEQAAYEEIRNVTIVQEVILPIFMMALSTDKAAQMLGTGGQTISTEIARLLLSDPRADNEGWKAIVEAFDKGDLPGATKNTVEFVTKSQAFRDIVSRVILSYISTRVESAVTDGLKLVGEIFARPLVFVNWILKAFDGTVLAINYEIADQASEFTLAMTPAKVTITSNSHTTGLRIGQTYMMEAVTQLGDQNAKLEYEWYHERDGYGHFTYGTYPDVHEEDSFTSSVPTTVYWKDVETGEDTVHVAVYGFKKVKGVEERFFLGSAEVTMTDDERGSCGAGDLELPIGTKLVFGSFTSAYSSSFFKLKQRELLETLPVNGPDFQKFEVTFGYKDGFVKGVRAAEDAYSGRDEEELLDDRNYYIFVVDEDFEFDAEDLPGAVDGDDGFVWSGTNRSVENDIIVRILDVSNKSAQSYTLWWDCWPYWFTDPKTGEFLL